MHLKKSWIAEQSQAQLKQPNIAEQKPDITETAEKQPIIPEEN